MKRTFGWLTVAALVLVSQPIRLASQGCSACEPVKNNYVQNLSTLEVCFDSDDFTEAQMDDMQSAMAEYWGSYFVQTGVPISFSFSRTSDCDPNLIEVTRKEIGSNPAQAQMSPDGYGIARIDVDFDWYGSSSDYQWLGAHEIGHIIGYEDVYVNGCDNETMMASGWNYDWGLMRCADLDANLRRWYYNDSYNYPPSEDPEWEDCFDIVYIKITYCKGPNELWYQCNYIELTTGHTCEPPY